jgi:hypothetical protein
MKFGIVSCTEWQLAQNVGDNRKKRLLETSFDSIVQRITDQATLEDYGRQKIRDYPGSKRVRIKLVLPPQTVDLFHNGAGGYRAQYCLGIQRGKDANRYVIDRLLEKLERLCANQPKRGCCWEFIKASLCDPDAWIWIHQGHWLRRKSLTDRNLIVKAWIKNGETQQLRKRALPIWARLTPDGEARLDVKGGSVDRCFNSIGVQLKPYRSGELHDLGYT